MKQDKDVAFLQENQCNLLVVIRNIYEFLLDILYFL